MINYVYNSKTNHYGYTKAPAASRVNSVHAVQVGNSLVVPMGSTSFTSGGSTATSGGVDSNSLEFLNEYEGDMRSLSSAADRIRGLNQGNVWDNLEVTSSDPSTAVMSDLGNQKISQIANYEIDVHQLAASQTSTTAAVMGSDSGGFTDGALTLRTGRTDSAGNALSMQVNVDTAGKTNQQVLTDIAAQIEGQFSTTGIHATVETNDAGESQLKLASVDTGKNHAFSLTGAGTGSSLALTNQTEAQNLKYTVNKNGAYVINVDGSPNLTPQPPIQEAESNNFVKIDAGTPGDNSIHNKTLTVDFKKTGKVTVSTSVDTEEMTKLTESFVDKYNRAVDMLVDNAHRGKGVETVRDRFLQAPISKHSMKTIGLDWGEDGKISFDKKAFQTALEKDPRMVYDILSDQYSVADTAYQKTQNAQSKSSASLLSNHPKFSAEGGANITINNFFVLPMPYMYAYAPVRTVVPTFLNMLI